MRSGVSDADAGCCAPLLLTISSPENRISFWSSPPEPITSSTRLRATSAVVLALPTNRPCSRSDCNSSPKPSMNVNPNSWPCVSPSGGPGSQMSACTSSEKEETSCRACSSAAYRMSGESSTGAPLPLVKV